MRVNLIQIADDFYCRLSKSGVCFSADGFPLFSKEMLLEDVPDKFVSYKQIASVENKSKVAVCFFQKDEFLYPRFRSMDRDIRKFQEFMGVCGFDLSPNIYWPEEQQMFNILLGQLYTAYLAINGIKIIPNWRIGTLRTLKVLKSYPQDSQFAVGTLGSVRNDKFFGVFYMKAKILISHPSRLLVYGKLLPEYSKELEEEGIRYIQYDDTMSQRNALRRKEDYGC